MFTAIAFLSLTPMIEDAMLRQLLDRHPKFANWHANKRATAAREFLDNAMKRGDQLRAQIIFDKVEKEVEKYFKAIHGMRLNGLENEHVANHYNLLRLYDSNLRLKKKPPMRPPNSGKLPPTRPGVPEK